MNIFRRIAANTVWLFAAQASNRLAGFLVAVLLSRYLGAHGFGEYSFVTAYVGFFVLITDMGIDMFITREASRDLKGSEGIVGNALVLKIFFSLLAFALSLGTALLIGIPGTKWILIAIASLGLLLAPFTLYTSAFAATLRLHYPAIFEILGRVILLCLVGAVILTGGSLPAIFIALVLPGGCVALLNVLYARRLFRPRLSFQWPMGVTILAKSIPIAVTLVFTQILLRIDQLMLEWMRGDHELGLYSAGVKCCEALNVIPAVFIVSIFPLLSRAAQGPRESFSRMYHLSFKYLCVVLVPLIGILSLYPGEILALLFGEDFRPGGAALRILCWSALFVAMGYVIMTTTVSLDHQRLLIGVTALLAGLNITLNLVLIPRTDALGGANGAALATMISYSASLLVLLAYPVLRPVALSFLQNSIKPLIALVPVLLMVRMTSMTMVSGILASAMVYVVTIMLVRGFNRADREYLGMIFRRD